MAVGVVIRRKYCGRGQGHCTVVVLGTPGRMRRAQVGG